MRGAGKVCCEYILELRTEISKDQRKGRKKVGCDVSGIRYHAQAVKENAALKGRLL